MADEDCHAQVLEASGVADPAVLDPQIVHAQKLFAETLSPEEVGVPLERADDVVVVDLGEDPFLLAPHAGSVGPGGAAHARVEEAAPVRAIELGQGLHVVLNVQEATGAAAVDDFIERVRLGRCEARVERDVLGGEVVRRGAVAPGLVPNVLIGGAGSDWRRRLLSWRRAIVCGGIECGGGAGYGERGRVAFGGWVWVRDGAFWGEGGERGVEYGRGSHYRRSEMWAALIWVSVLGTESGTNLPPPLGATST